MKPGSGAKADGEDPVPPPTNAVIRILSDIEHGDPAAAERLLPLVYDELRNLAAQMLAQEKPGQTLQPTALVHEAYLRLVGDEPEKPWNGRRHFFGAAAEAMRRVLIDRARNRSTAKARRGVAGAFGSTSRLSSSIHPTRTFWHWTRLWRQWCARTQPGPSWSGYAPSRA